MDFERRLTRANTNSSKDPWDEKIGLSHELFSLVKILPKNKATNPRDKILALSEVVNDLDCFTPEVDYNSYFRNIYSAYSKWFVQRCQDFSVLKLVGVNPAVVEQPKATCCSLPSCVPDFRSYNAVTIVALNSDHNTSYIGQSGPTMPQDLPKCM
jgi:hypothetical protein